MTLSPGVTEYQRDGIRRMLRSVLAAPQHPGPCALVGHGLLVCALFQHQDRSGGAAVPPLFLPETPHLEPVAIPDDELPPLVTSLVDDLDSVALRAAFVRLSAALTRRYRGSVKGRRLLPSIRYPSPFAGQEGSSSCMMPAP
ncbi:hypothetical protein ACIP88_15750 [Streptomyces uncialis]|uniref:hypothetical protein n=1 Tax=Streptomyces uncialis TaxID=1048205 RepID=UPI00380C476E